MVAPDGVRGPELANFGLDFSALEPRVYYQSAERMAPLADASVDLVVTSPPYGSIKDYGIAGQIGFQDSFAEYFRRLRNVWAECHRVLKPGRRLVVNVGDQYLRASEHGRYRILPIGCRVVEDCRALGFDFLGDVIWQKISTTNTTGGCSLMGSLFYPRNGLLTYDYEHVLIFKKTGQAPRERAPYRAWSKIPLDEWKRWFVGHWRFPGVVQKEHVAMFPEELPYRLVRMFSLVNDTVLDPFAGSGTTLKVAWALLRRGVGFEINPAFEPIIDQKVAEARPGLFRDFQFLLNHLHTRHLAAGAHFEFNAKFARRRGIVALRDTRSGRQLVVDYLSAAERDSELAAALQKQLDVKFAENNVQNYVKGRKAWAGIDAYVVVANLGGETLPAAADMALRTRQAALPPDRPVHLTTLRDFLATDVHRWFEAASDQ